VHQWFKKRSTRGKEINDNNNNAIQPNFLVLLCHVKWVPCHHGMARLHVADGGEGLQIWGVAVNILNKQSRTVDKGWSSSLVIGRGGNKPSP
jgi:hypothetical protein